MREWFVFEPGLGLGQRPGPERWADVEEIRGQKWTMIERSEEDEKVRQ